DVAGVRPRVVAPAQMHSQPFGRDVAERVVERGDVHADALAKLLGREVRELHVPTHREVGAVDLQGDAGLGDRLVLVAQPLGECEDILFVAGVVLVGKEQRGHPGRSRAHEGLVPARQALEALGVLARGVHVDDLDRRSARRRLAACTAGVAEYPRLGAGELLEVGKLVLPGLAAEARQPVLDVGRVAGLRHLAIADDADPGPFLALDHVSRRTLDRLVECALVDRLAALAGEHQREQVVGARQAPRVGGTEAAHASSARTIAAPSAIAFILPNATSRGRYLSPQSGATMIFSAGTCGSARRMRAATVSGVSTSCVDRSSTPRMIVLPGSVSSTEVSRFDCAVSIEICLTSLLPSSGRNE